MSRELLMVKNSKEVQGLLYKCAELETLIVVLIGMLAANSTLTQEEAESILEVAAMPEILSARIKRIEEQGTHLLEARKKLLREKLGITPFTNEEKGEPIIQGVLEDAELPEKARDPDKKLH
jgi:hypothetical protein